MNIYARETLHRPGTENTVPYGLSRNPCDDVTDIRMTFSNRHSPATVKTPESERGEMIYDEQGCFYQPPGYKMKRIRAKEMSEQDRTQFWSDLEAGSSETLD